MNSICQTLAIAADVGWMRYEMGLSNKVHMAQYISYGVRDSTKGDAKVFIYQMQTAVKSILGLRARFHGSSAPSDFFSLMKITLNAPTVIHFHARSQV